MSLMKYTIKFITTRSRPQNRNGRFPTYGPAGLAETAGDVSTIGATGTA